METVEIEVTVTGREGDIIFLAKVELSRESVIAEGRATPGLISVGRALAGL